MAAKKSSNGSSDVFKFAKDNGAKVMDLRFCDLPGTWQHTSYPIRELTEDFLKEGLGFDGSSIRGFQKIHESDMILIPDVSTAHIDPFLSTPTLVLVCNVHHPGEAGLTDYSRDPRYVARKAEAYLKKSGLGDTVYFGPEAEFFVFDSVKFDNKANATYAIIDSAEGIWNSGADGQNGNGNLGHRPRHKEGYFPVPPVDTLMDVRSEMILAMEACGVTTECHHHEVSTAGQCEIDMRFTNLLRMADNLMVYKYCVKNVARKHGKTATFMPKPLFGDNGSGMHCHQSIWKGGKPLFADPKGYAGVSKMCLHYIGGLLKHAPALLGILAPTTNSYRRLTPGFEAPVNLVYSQRNRSAAARIPVYSTSPASKRVEFRCPDPATNPYLAFAAMLMAGLDGIKNKIDPGEPHDEDLYELSAEEAAKIPSVPGSLTEALDALEKDHDFLLQGDVFTPDVIETWIDYKRSVEVDPVRLRPVPYEYHLYYDC
jgi:glutamine synthetase